VASEKCVLLLLSANEFGALDEAAQSARLVEWLVQWFEPTPPGTIDHIRWVQRVRAHSGRLGVCVGDLMMEMLQEAKVLHAAGQSAHQDEDQANAISLGGEPDETVLVGDFPFETTVVEASAAGDVPEQVQEPAQQVQELTPEPMTDVPLTPAPSGSKRRSNRVK
jgi:hypothetical protein